MQKEGNVEGWEEGRKDRLTHPMAEFRHILREYAASLRVILPTPLPITGLVTPEIMSAAHNPGSNGAVLSRDENLFNLSSTSPRNLEGTVAFLLAPRTESTVTAGSPSPTMCSATRTEEARLWSKQSGSRMEGPRRREVAVVGGRLPPYYLITWQLEMLVPPGAEDTSCAV